MSSNFFGFQYPAIKEIAAACPFSHARLKAERAKGQERVSVTRSLGKLNETRIFFTRPIDHFFLGRVTCPSIYGFKDVRMSTFRCKLPAEII